MDLDRSPLPPMDVAGRLDRLRAALADPGVETDALLVGHLTNVRYLTGFTGSAALLLVTPADTVFVTDGRYRDRAAAELDDAGVAATVEVVNDAEATVVEHVARLGLPTLGLEADTITWSAQRRLSESLASGAGGCRAVPTAAVVETLRLTKDDGEVARIRAAAAIADRALDTVRHRLLDGLTEAEFAAELDATMRALGADDLSFETIVASGPNGARPHHTPSSRRIEHGDLVVVDFGALVDGYHSDMTRTLGVGSLDEERRHMLDVVLGAQAAGVAAVVSGVDCATVDKACRDLIDEAGMGDAFLHSTGHGVGLDIHEEPRVSSRSTATLRPGHVVTVEPGVYLTGIGGVRIEDTVLVTDDGCDRLTLTPKDPVLA
ncbi:MAG: aminopeptidase P family protein [Actinomycetes bacterium]